MSEGEKKNLLSDFSTHLEVAQKERDYYLLAIKKSKEAAAAASDNCVGQNKNKSVLAYFMWCTLVGLTEEITLPFMRVGHTRCMVDACFGLLKKR